MGECLHENAMNTHSNDREALSTQLPGTWELESRVDVTESGERRLEPSLGSDPIALLIYDRSGHFAAQFMKRDRGDVRSDAPATVANNTQARDGYDAYFGTYTVDDSTGVVTQRLEGSLSRGNVGMVLSRAMSVHGTRLAIQLATGAWDGTPVTRTLTWERVSS